MGRETTITAAVTEEEAEATVAAEEVVDIEADVEAATETAGKNVRYSGFCEFSEALG